MMASRRPDELFPAVREKVIDLHGLTIDMSGKQIHFDEYDHFAFMSLSFLSAQIEHTGSLLVLIKNQEYRDATLIARCMIEGLAQLVWARSDAQERGRRWRAFSYVTDWRKARRLLAIGKGVDDGQHQQIETAIKTLGDEFLTRKAANAKREGKPLPDDPYCENWTGHPISKLLEKVGAEVLYKTHYKSFSAWHHWSPEGIGPTIKRSGAHVEFRSPSVDEAVRSLVVAFQCLFQTADMVNQHLALGFGGRLTELRKKYIELLGAAPTGE